MDEPTERRPIRVVVVDDHPVVRQGTQTLLEQTADIEVVGSTGEGREALLILAAKHSDILLLDLHLPDMSGIEVAARVRRDYPDVAVLVMTAHEEVGYIRTLVHLGVRGYLGKTVTGDELIAAIRTVMRGGTALVSEGVRAALNADPATLTEREQEVLQLLVVGCRNKEIADTLCVTVKTAEFHVGHVLEKLGVRSRAEAISAARRQGLVREGKGSEPF